jgi:hypothetical protein
LYFLFLFFQLTKTEALAMCNGDDMQLISLQTEEKWIEIKTYLEETRK